MANYEIIKPFLQPVGNHVSGEYRPLPRRGCNISPLINTYKTFVEIEKAILNAKEKIWLGYWHFNSGFCALSRECKNKKIKTWTHLLTQASQKGVDVRLILSDFDPVLQNEWHRACWRGYYEFFNESYDFNPDFYQAITVLHPAIINIEKEYALNNLIYSLLIKDKFQEIIDLLNDILKKKPEFAFQEFKFMPRIWDYINYSNNGFFRNEKPFLDIAVGSFHYKLAIIDDVAFMGGSNVIPEFIDDDKHKSNPFRHDINCRIEGSIIHDIQDLFKKKWNDNVFKSIEFINNIPDISHFEKPIIGANNQIGNRILYKKNSKVGSSIVQLLRTESIGFNSNTESPKIIRHDHVEAYESAILSAKKYIYIENQYFRWKKIAEFIIKAYKLNPLIQVVIVIPAFPEELNLENNKVDILTNHGIYLQKEALKLLKTELKSNLGVFTLSANTEYYNSNNDFLIKKYCPQFDVENPGKPVTAPLIVQEGLLKRIAPIASPSIYVHSKVLIVDDSIAIIGSANISGRSFYLDDEIGILYSNEIQVKKFRTLLWSEHIGLKYALNVNENNMLKLWQEAATQNSLMPHPEKRISHVVKFYDNYDGVKSDSYPKAMDILCSLDHTNKNYNIFGRLLIKKTTMKIS